MPTRSDQKPHLRWRGRSGDLDAIGVFLLAKWKERAAELGLPEPNDLAGSCKFASLFVQSLYGGEIRGNYDHFHVVLDGSVLDPNRGSSDVRAILDAGRDPHLHHRSFMRSRAVRESLDSCRPRVDAWVSEFLGSATGGSGHLMRTARGRRNATREPSALHGA